ncbi:GTP pyrophosphokinase [Citrobacter portucalensis]|uniref:GTP pyrophosphokinase n=1 Tax=Citrobacter portucalensis TaxID=1639133 RepID=UPI00216285F3|nr:hypothetical protein [Citrobacter portucalensis]MCS0538329.1 hypothetical protein [Citrobacter portucalensis]
MDDITEKYSMLKPQYESLMNIVRFSLEQIIGRKEISLFGIDGRVKSLNSLKEKIIRKPYSNPFNEIEDFCGLRLICYYTSDMDEIASIIRKEFHVLSESDKQKEAGEDKFGYLSMHFIVKLKDEWLSAPLYECYKEHKIEIQLRTMLMHTWAAISHKLLYKSEDDAPKELKRRLNRLSALIELADEQFNLIKGMKNDYIEKLNNNEIDKNTPLNSDGLILLVEKYSPGRVIDNDSIPKFLAETQMYGITIADFESLIQKAMPVITTLEKELAAARGLESIPMWSAMGFCRTVLDLTNESYFNSRWSDDVLQDFVAQEDDEESIHYWTTWIQLMKKYREALAS